MQIIPLTRNDNKYDKIHDTIILYERVDFQPGIAIKKKKNVSPLPTEIGSVIK